MQALRFDQKNAIESPPIKRGEVHLWWLSLDIEEALVDQFRTHLSEKQCQKLNRLPSKIKQQRYIAGRGYLYQLLQHYLPDDASIELQFGEHGKPSLKDKTRDLQFNFTDTCGFGLFAFSLASELGVDVENVNREGNFDRIIERRFAKEEQHCLAQVLTAEKVEYFLRCWTRKEAYGKAMGCGLNYTLRDHVMCLNLSQEQFGVERANNAEAMQSESMSAWQGQQFSIEQGDDRFIACLFSQGVKQNTVKAFRLAHAS